MEKQYFVSAHGLSDVPPAEVIAAEVRFIKTLERQLGDSDAVVDIYCAWQEASESSATEVSASTWALADKWPKAFQAAQQAGLKNIGENEAYFEMHLERQNASTE